MHVAVCIVGFRNPHDIKNCLISLTWTKYADFEVVICENGGAAACEAVREAVAAVSELKRPVSVICAQGNLGYAGGVNLCMDHAMSADAWWVLNPDTLPDPDALARMSEQLAAGDCHAIGCTIHNADGIVGSRGGHWIPWLARAVALDHGKRLDDPASPHLESELSYISGASMLIGRAFVERVGKMREDYFLYGEEVEWCLRGLAGGLRLGMAVDALVLHHQGTTTGAGKRHSDRGRLPVFLDERNKLLITRDSLPLLLPVVILGSLAMLLLRFARRGAWMQAGYALQGWWSGIKNERDKPAWLGD